MIVAKTKKIDGIKMVIGLSELQVDPVETEKAIREDYQKSKEFQALAVRLTKIRSYTQAINTIDVSASKLYHRVAKRKDKMIFDVVPEDLTTQESEKLLEYANLKVANQGSVKAIESELPEVDVNLKNRRLALIKENAVYFEPSKDDVILTDLQVVDFKANLVKLGRKQFLTLDGDIIDDNRNRTTYFNNTDNTWTIKKIMVLDESIDSLCIFSEDLTDLQRQEIAEYQEAVRISGLSVSDKTAELESMIDSLAGQAAVMRSKLEIQDDNEALTKAQDWYNAEVLEVEDKYK